MSFFRRHSPSGPPEVPQQPQFYTAYACMSLHRYDTIRFLGFQEGLLSEVKSVIENCWERGISDTELYGGAYEIRLHGYPWGSTEKPAARLLTRTLLEVLWNAGWVLRGSIDISKRKEDKDSLIFRRHDPPPPPCYWLTIAFHHSDRLLVINANDEINNALARTFGDKVSKTSTDSWFEIKFHGYPWDAAGKETVAARILLLQLLDCLETFGYSLYASMDQTNDSTSENSSDADVLVFNRDVNWVPGAPIWRR